MSDFRTINRYALSFFEYSSGLKKEQRAFDDAKLLLGVCAENRELFLLLKNPVVRGIVKENVLLKVFDKFFDQETKNFIRMLIDNKREDLLPEIFTRFVSLYKERNGIVEAEVKSAVPLQQNEKDKITEYIKLATNSKSVELNNIIDDKLIGGFAVKYHDMLLDISVKNKLNNLKKKFNY